MPMVEIAGTRQTQSYPRAQFILHIGLIVIFPQAILWGLKTPANQFVFAGIRKETKDVEAYGWSVQTNARFFYSQHN